MAVPMSDIFTPVTPINSSSLTSMKYLTESEMDALAILSVITSLMSFLGAGSVLFCSVCHRRVLVPEVFPTFHLSMADILSSLFLLISSCIFLMAVPTFPGSPGPCGYIMTVVTSSYTSAFLLTIAYAMEAFFRFRCRLKDHTRLDTITVKAVSSRWMYLMYVVAWIVPFSLAIVLMVATHNLRDKDDITPVYHIITKQCSSCFADFRFNEAYCWEQVEEGAKWHQVIRLIFLLPLIMVMGINMALYFLIAKVFKQVAMRRGLLSYHQRQEENLLRRKAVMYQGVFFICWLPSIILGIASFTENYSMVDYYWLLLVQAIVGPLQGLFNSILYGWKRDSFRRALSESSSLLSTNRSTAMCLHCLTKSEQKEETEEEEAQVWEEAKLGN